MFGIEEEIWIRDFRRPDLASALKVLELSFVDEFDLEGLDPERTEKMANQMFGVLGRILRGFLKILGKEFFRLLVAEIDGRVVGTIMVSRQRRVAYISAVAVHPDFRRRGIARRLVGSALQYIKTQKMKRAVLHVITTNSPAKTLYLDLKFKNFEKVALLAANVEGITSPEHIKEIEMTNFRESQADAAYELLRTSEDPKHLEIFDYRKDDLKTTFFERIFHLDHKEQLIASRNGRIIGYAEATYTTSREAGRIGNVQVSPELKGRGVEEMLVYAGARKVKRAEIKRVIGTASSQRPELIAAMTKLGFVKRLELDGMYVEFQ